MLVLGLIIGLVVGVLATVGIVRFLTKKKCTRGYVILATSEYGDSAAGIKFNDPDSLDTKKYVILKVMNQEEATLK